MLPESEKVSIIGIILRASLRFVKPIINPITTAITIKKIQQNKFQLHISVTYIKAETKQKKAWKVFYTKLQVRKYTQSFILNTVQ